MKYITFILLFTVSSLVNAQTVVVVSKASKIQTLEAQQVANIFLARTRQFPDGQKATPIELTDLSLRNAFYQGIAGKTLKQLHAYWTTLVFTGKGKPPKGFKNSDALQQKLLSQPGMITYLPAEQVTDDMKIVYSFP
jgi:hypothetical protein